MTQKVRVARRIRMSDGMGGASERYSTVIQNYWTRIWADHHLERERIEPGEAAKNPTHLAVGARAVNGKSINLMDRFIDEENNEVYDVVGVRRPKDFSGYGLVSTYTLRIVKDACELMAEGSLPAEMTGGTTGEGGAGGGSETHLILRHFEVSDLENIRLGSVDYGSYDGFVYGHSDQEQETVSSLIDTGKLHFFYVNIMEFPPDAFSDPWFDFWRDEIRDGLGAGLENPSGDPAIFKHYPDCTIRRLVDWSKINAAARLTIANKLFSLAPRSGLFLDQAWLDSTPEYFFCTPSGSGSPCPACPEGATYESILASKWPLWQASIFAFYELCDQMAAGGNRWVIKNGEHRMVGSPAQKVPRPIFYENSAANGLEAPPRLQNSIAGWREHPRNVLSIIVPDEPSLATVLAAWDESGGWISFTGPEASDPDAQAAYVAAGAIKAVH
jgi:hypothetical protein